MAVDLPSLPPAEAIRIFRAKGFRIGFDWRDVWQQEHARAVTVAKAMRLDVLTDIRAAVDAALAGGTTFQQFRETLEPTLRAKGWWGRVNQTDPLTGETAPVQLGSPRRLKIIFDTNLRGAYAAGTWERIERVKARRPFLRYVSVLDDRTRPEHRAWHDTVLPVDDPFWSTHYPPNGWRCRCTVQQLSRRDMDRAGIGESPNAPPRKPKPFRNKRTGEVSQIPDGIDPGFAFNNGKAAAGRAPRTGREAEALDLLAAKVDQAPLDIARQAMNQQRASRDFAGFAAGGTPGAMPVAVLDAGLAARIGAKGRAVRFSQETAVKQMRVHPHLTPVEYGRLQRLIDSGEAILDRDRHIVFQAREEGRWWRAVIKTTRDGRELYLVSLSRLAERHAERLRRRGAVIRK